MRCLLLVLAGCGVSDPEPCEPVTQYPDTDGDGYGDASADGGAICPGTPGWTTDRSDCADGDPAAHPGQTVPSVAPIAGFVKGPPYDFNCDGAETRLLTGLSACRTDAASTSPGDCGLVPPGWLTTEPGCGQGGGWVAACTYSNAASPRCYEPGVTTQFQLCL